MFAPVVFSEKENEMDSSRIQYDRWLSQPSLDASLRAELSAMADDAHAIDNAFGCELTFGTGGLRGILGAGTNRMNVHVVRRAAQATADVLNAASLPRRAAIGYDSRIGSERFARETACVLAANGIETYLYPRLEPVPALSFAVRTLSCGVGICITASHNPAQYNGFKVYGSDGCQLTPEGVAQIADNLKNCSYFNGIQIGDFTALLASGSIRWIPEQVYDKGNLPIDLDSLRGRMCYGGLDLSSTSDITALVLAFPPRTEEEKYVLLPFFWLPEDTLELRCRRDHVLYDVWQKQGFIQTTEGNVIHYGFIEKFIEHLGETYNIREIAYDRWNATQMVQNLEDMGVTMVPFGQGFKDMSPPSKELFKLLMEGNIIHGGNPVLKWMAGNVVMRQDPAGNIKPDKEKSVEKIDGIVASIMALDRCIRNGAGCSSVYDERGVIVF